MEKPAETERTEKIEWLVVCTGWARGIFERMTPEELERIYDERVTNR